MNIHDACEEAFKRGYERGRAEAIKEFVKRAKNKGVANIPIPLERGKNIYFSVRVDDLDQIAEEMGVEL